MSAFDHGEPEDGDLVESSLVRRDPQRGQRGDQDADPLGGRRSRSRRSARHARDASRERGRNMPADMPRIRRSISAAPFTKSAAMTRSCC